METILSFKVGDYLDESKFECVRNDRFMFNKPSGCLWGSTYTPNEDFPSKWVEWGIYEEFFNTNEDFNGLIYSLKLDSRVLRIETAEDFIHLLLPFYTIFGKLIKYGSFRKDYICDAYCSFEDIAKSYDAMHISDNVIHYFRGSDVFKKLRSDGLIIEYNGFDTMDVESWILFNLNCIDESSIKYVDLNYVKKKIL